MELTHRIGRSGSVLAGLAMLVEVGCSSALEIKPDEQPAQNHEYSESLVVPGDLVVPDDYVFRPIETTAQEINRCISWANRKIGNVKTNEDLGRLVEDMRSCVSAIECGEGCPYAGYLRQVKARMQVEGQIVQCNDMFNIQIGSVKSETDRQKLVDTMRSCVSAIECGVGCPYTDYLRRVNARMQ